MKTETYYVLYDPERERYYSRKSIGRVFARAAEPFMKPAAAERCRDSWWENKRFSQVCKVELTISDTDVKTSLDGE